MIARSRFVGNFLSHCAVHRQLTKGIGFNQSIRLQSTNDNSELPLNATGISVEHSNACQIGKSLDGTSLRVTLVLQSNKCAPESEQSHKQLDNLKKTNKIFVNGRFPS